MKVEIEKIPVYTIHYLSKPAYGIHLSKDCWRQVAGNTRCIGCRANKLYKMKISSYTSVWALCPMRLSLYFLQRLIKTVIKSYLKVSFILVFISIFKFF